MSPEIEAARSKLIERLMLTDPSYDESFDRIVRLLKTITGASAAAFTVLDGGRQFYKSHEGMAVRETQRDVSFCTHTIEQTDLLVVPDARLDRRFSNSPLVCGPDGHCFYAGMPVRAPSGLPLGALCVLDEQPRNFDQRERDAIMDLTGALEESLILRSLSVVDALTGLFNRRHFEEVVSREWTRSFAAQTPIAIAMVDIDYFKKYNDSYGHPAGDTCLRRIAQALRTGARLVGDVLARLGGEEFVLVLPNTHGEMAEMLSARIQQSIAALDIPHRGSPLGKVTASIGFAIVTNPWAESLESAMQRADDALYQAKALGRNRALIAAVG
jgi:diguanylate cyclase (GGDEF)-like protein